MRKALAMLILLPFSMAGAGEQIVIASKNFTESYLLAEIMARKLELDGFDVVRRFGLGGTKVCYSALESGEIDLYPEYTGTIGEVILRGVDVRDAGALSENLAARDLETGEPFGFNNTYALAVRETYARRLGLSAISELAGRADIRASFSHEFLNRPDGWPGLAKTYSLGFSAGGIEHGLAYKAIEDGEIDITDAYSTDGELTAYGLTILRDDLGYFPQYLAVPLMRAAIPERAKQSLAELRDSLSDDSMRNWNARIVIDRVTYQQVATEFLDSLSGVASGPGEHSNVLSRLAGNTARHLQLTFIALLAATLVGLLLAAAVYRSTLWSSISLNITGLLQTIPSIALLALMIPLFGIGFLPAVVALFLYSLLPILRNTVTALTTVDPVYIEVATAMGLTEQQILRHVLFPLSVPQVLAGIRTAAVISIGTATLAAFIGAGGLGEPIVTGLALNDTQLILQGAVPAAILALLTEFIFVTIERVAIPAHLRAATASTAT